MIKYGYVALGIVDEHPVENPLFQWRESQTPYDVTIAGLTSEGSAVFYGVDCPILNKRDFYPRGYCNNDQDCLPVPNTLCLREPEPDLLPTTTIQLMTCRCADGFEPIPGKLLVLFFMLEFTKLILHFSTTESHQNWMF